MTLWHTDIEWHPMTSWEILKLKTFMKTSCRQCPSLVGWRSWRHSVHFCGSCSACKVAPQQDIAPLGSWGFSEIVGIDSWRPQAITNARKVFALKGLMRSLVVIFIQWFVGGSQHFFRLERAVHWWMLIDVDHYRAISLALPNQKNQ